jgi:hypothetical protein
MKVWISQATIISSYELIGDSLRVFATKELAEADCEANKEQMFDDGYPEAICEFWEVEVEK